MDFRTNFVVFVIVSIISLAITISLVHAKLIIPAIISAVVFNIAADKARFTWSLINDQSGSSAL